MWRPILDGPLRAQAFQVIDEIAAAIKALTGHGPVKNRRRQKAKPVEQQTTDASLAGGQAGLAVFYAYLDQARTGHEDKQTALRFVDQAMDAAASVPMDFSLYGGVTGIAWTIAHLNEWLVQVDDDATEVADQWLRKVLGQRPWRVDYDLISGLTGVGVYALERLPAAWAVQCLAQVVDRLGEIARRTPDGLSWFTPAELLPESQRESAPNGYYNLGMAHGVAGVIAFLAKVHALDERHVRDLMKLKRKVRRLLEDAVAWLLAQRSSTTADYIFPNWVGPSVTPGRSRLAWCYGDLGIAIALFAAGNSLNNASWKRQASRLAKHAAGRTFEQSGVKDCGLCHGAAGVAHLFNHMFQKSGDVRMKSAARTWFERAFEMRRPGKGVAGFAAFRLDHWSNEVGILEGSAGIALAFLAATTPVEPQWDRMLLL